jgi:hypothetical protein
MAARSDNYEFALEKRDHNQTISRLFFMRRTSHYTLDRELREWKIHLQCSRVVGKARDSKALDAAASVVSN